MKFSQRIKIPNDCLIVFTIGFLLLILCSRMVYAQTVSMTQDLDFGTFANPGPAGTITVTPAGGISSTGGIKSLNTSYHQAVLEVTFKPKNHSVSISYDNNLTLTGSKGGTLKLALTPTNTFSNPLQNPLIINIGGTLTIDGPLIDPPGTYSGTIKVYCTFNI